MRWITLGEASEVSDSIRGELWPSESKCTISLFKHGCQPKNRRILPPTWMVKIMENPYEQMDDLGENPYFWVDTHIWNCHDFCQTTTFKGPTRKVFLDVPIDCFLSWCTFWMEKWKTNSKHFVFWLGWWFWHFQSVVLVPWRWFSKCWPKIDLSVTPKRCTLNIKFMF